MEELKAKARELGVNIDARWGEPRLRKEVETARRRAAKALAGPGLDGQDAITGKPVEDDAVREEMTEMVNYTREQIHKSNNSLDWQVDTLPAPADLFPVKLLKNYAPAGEFNVVGTIEPTYAGTGFASKVWQGSIVELTRDEARAVIEKGIAVSAVTP